MVGVHGVFEAREDGVGGPDADGGGGGVGCFGVVGGGVGPVEGFTEVCGGASSVTKCFFPVS